MGFKFRKRVKIAPGVHLNLGGKSASVSVGPRGAKLNIGQKGVRATVGIPGTGISYTEKLSSGKPAERSSTLSYSAYMRLPKAQRAAYREAGGEVPRLLKVVKFLVWATILFWGMIFLLAILSKMA